MSAAAAVEATTSASQAIVRPSVLTRCSPVSVLGRADRFNCDDGLKSLEDGSWLGVGVPERESESERAVWGSPRSERIAPPANRLADHAQSQVAWAATAARRVPRGETMSFP